MNMSCDIAHDIVVTSYMDTSSEVAQDDVIHGYVWIYVCDVVLYKYTNFLYVFIEQILKLTVIQ